MIDLEYFADNKSLPNAFEILGAASCGFGITVFVVHWLMYAAIPTFRLQPSEVRVYAAKNMAKSAALAAYMPLAVKMLTDLYFTHELEPGDVRLAGTLYACTDIVGLFMVSKHSKTTLFHHVTVTGLAVYNLVYTFQGIWRGFVVYGCFCTFTFLVNTTLSLKGFLSRPALRVMRTLSLVTYVLACLPNWVLQLYYIRNFFVFDANSCAFVTLMLFIVIDDCVLMNWLAAKDTRTK